jgi:hypothetical protein
MKKSHLIIAACALAQFPSTFQQAFAGSEEVCKISCVAPYPMDAESIKVIAVIENITKALADRDYERMKQYMDDGCTTYDENTKRTVVGRDAIVADVKSKIAADELKYKAPLLAYKIDRPFVKVNGDTAVVCFVLIKELGGDHPQSFESHCTDVFVKHGEDWKKLNFRGEMWKRAR